MRLSPFQIVLLLCMYLCCVNTAYVQESNQSLPVSIGYFANAAIYPGLSVSTNWTVKELRSATDETKWARSLVFRPTMGYFTRPNKNDNAIVLADLGIQFSNPDRKRYGILGLGLSYWFQSEVLSKTVSLGSGDISGKNRTERHSFVPTASYEHGHRINSKLAWYLRLHIGHRFSADVENEMALFFQAGISRYFNRSKS